MNKHTLTHRSSFLSTLARISLGVVVFAGILGLSPVMPALAVPPVPVPYLVKDIYSGSNGSDPYNLTAVNNTVFFASIDAAHGDELWSSDGTEAGTRLVRDIYPGKFNSRPENLTDVNGTLFFVANDGTHGDELWRSDGTEAGTVMVKDIYLGSGGSSPEYLTSVNGKLFFAAIDETHGAELWYSDGTEAGTVLVKDIRPGNNGSSLDYLTDVNGTLFFTADNGTNGYELWRSDGSEAGTVLVKDIYPGSGSSILTSSIARWAADNGTLYFAAADETHGYELWRSDGTEAGTVLVKDIYPGNNSSIEGYYGIDWVVIDGTLMFAANDGPHGYELWRSDGTEAGTTLVKDIYPGPGTSVASYYGTSSVVSDGVLFFDAANETSGNELWRSDGTEAGTVLVKDIYPGIGNSHPEYLTDVNGTLFFNAFVPSYGYELWQSDGTGEGTMLVQDIYPGSTSSYPSYLINVNGRLFFNATNSDFYYYNVALSMQSANIEPYGNELWSLRYINYLPVSFK